MSRSLHLLYHEIRPTRSEYSYVTSCEAFEAHCALYARLQASQTPERLRPEVTFDDGHLSDFQHAMPALTRAGLTGCFFITAGWTGKRANYMDWAQLRELQTSGQQIGAHGLTHKLLTSCSQTELHRELRVAKEMLEDGLGQCVDSMSLPGGRADRRVFQACVQAGYTQIFSSIPRAEDMEQRPQTVGRLNLVAGTEVAWLESLLNSRSGVLARIQRIDRLKTYAKKVVGDQFYAKIWAVANRQEVQAAEPEIGAE